MLLQFDRRVALALSVSAFVGCQRPAAVPQAIDGAPTAEQIYVNARIYTVDDASPWAEALAVADGEILSVGSRAEVEALKTAGTEVIDLHGSFVMPGLHDTHVHLEQAYAGDILGDALLTFPADPESLKQLQDLLVAHGAKNPEQDVLFAQNLPQAIFPNGVPTKAFIDDVISDRPVVILSNTEHEGLLNSRALELEGITAQTKDPEGGTIDRDPATGEATGYLRETAAGKWAWKHFPALEPAEHEQGLAGTIAYLNSVGVTSVKQQHAKEPIALAARSLEKREELHARLALAWTWMGPLEPMPLSEQSQLVDKRGRFDTELIDPNFVKLSIDGNAGTTGFVLDPYLVTGTRGWPVFTDLKLLVEQIERFDRLGMGVVAHATGDAANRQMIDAVEAVLQKHGELLGRHQLAHGSLIHPEDYPRLAPLGLTVEFSPVIWYPLPFAEAQRPQLGDERMSRWYPMAAVVDAGARINIASDGPLFWQGPFQAMETAVTRRAPGGQGEALAPGQAIDVARAILAMTLDSAYLMNQDQKVGSLAAGKRADFIVLDRNLLEIEPTEIGGTKVLLTVFDGEVVHRSDD